VVDVRTVHAVVADVLRAEAQAVAAAADRLHADHYERAVQIVADCAGKVLTTGAGVSGIIASKIAATLTSTGTPSVFLHPADALHGGLGVVDTGDVVLAVSNSGETGELLVILPYLRSRHVSLISIVGSTDSRLARASDAVLDAGVDRETGPMQLAPTSSSTLALAVGDALAMAVLSTKSFTPDHFARNHPSGRLGRRLTLTVDDVVVGDLPRPAVQHDQSLMDAIECIGSGGVGAVLVLAGESLVGLVTDGDVRRSLRRGPIDPLQTTVAEIMTQRPTVVESGTLAYDALQMMEDRETQISVLPVVSRDGSCIGLIRVHDLVRAGV
jgi:arabinose-5-phosphate isomerase